MTKKDVIGIVSGAVVFAVLMGVATFYDLQISMAIGNAESVFGQFFDILGEFPLWAGIPAAFLIFYRGLDETGKYRSFLKASLLVCVFAGCFFFAAFLMEEIKNLKWKYLYVTVFAAALCFSLIAATAKADKIFMRKLYIFAVLILAAAAASQVVVQSLKAIWARQRFRNMLSADSEAFSDYRGYTPWYKPVLGRHNPDALYPDAAGGKGETGAYGSFPSGHSAAAALAFSVVILPEIFEKLKKYQPWFYCVPALYTVMVMVSRIVNRAHFLSDVAVGAGISVLCVFWLKFSLKKAWVKRRLPGYEIFTAGDGAEIGVTEGNH